ncbi:MAG TPA: hypothetical protein V6D47_06440 [Oscillatoriaceae cyanobacterium]
MARAVFFSLGGGLGHLNRSLAIIRQLRREAPHLEPLVITNSPFCHLALSAGVPVLRLPSHFEQELLAQPELSQQLTLAALDVLSPIDVLIVDAYPEQLVPRLLQFIQRGRFLKVFVHRDERADLDDRLEAFHLIFHPYPAGASPERYQACGYIVSRQQQDVLTRPQARLRLGLAPEGEEPVILAFHAGSPAETMALFRQVRGASERLGLGHSLRLSTPQILPGVEYFYPHLVSLYPIMDVLEAADLVLCAGGYNAFAEVGSLGNRTLFRPLERAFDRQRGRTLGWPTFEAATSDVALAELMQAALAGPAPKRGNPQDYRGAEVMASAIANAMAVV